MKHYRVGVKSCVQDTPFNATEIVHPSKENNTPGQQQQNVNSFLVVSIQETLSHYYWTCDYHEKNEKIKYHLK